jgi:alpha/beta superfamily hydrolase
MLASSIDRSVDGVERRMLRVADGVELEAEIDVPEGATAAVVLAHPHPLYGGSMRTGAPAALFESLPRAGVAALRFNFRGVEGSMGTHDRGGAERLDVVAAIDELAKSAPDIPLVVCGWSFGGDVSLCIDDARVAAWCPIAPPLAVAPIEDMASVAADERPKVLLVPEHDQYSPPSRTRELTASWTSTDVQVIAMTDHFLGGALDSIGEVVLDVVRSVRTNRSTG